MALLVVGQVREKGNVAEPASEEDRAKGLGGLDALHGANWALPRETRKASRAPVSEL